MQGTPALRIGVIDMCRHQADKGVGRCECGGIACLGEKRNLRDVQGHFAGKRLQWIHHGSPFMSGGERFKRDASRGMRDNSFDFRQLRRNRGYGAVGYGNQHKIGIGIDVADRHCHRIDTGGQSRGMRGIGRGYGNDVSAAVAQGHGQVCGHIAGPDYRYAGAVVPGFHSGFFHRSM